MKATYFIIEQLSHLNNWEPVQNSESVTVEEAVASMELLQSEFGYEEMRIVEVVEYDDCIVTGAVICYSEE